MKLSVIIPVFNGITNLARVLPELQLSTRPPDEVIVVDDCSSDGTWEELARYPVKRLRLDGKPAGPGAARNAGSEIASGDLLIFLDSDVRVHPDTLERIENVFQENPGIDACFGSYDDSPPDQGIISRFKNLMHHYIHQTNPSEAATFWAGCGAIRREAFRSVGGFDVRFGRPSIEDIALGMRLRQEGRRILLRPEIQVTHLKRWTFLSWIRTDIRDRAIPWSRLLMEKRKFPNTLNLRFSHRISAIALWLLLMTIPFAVLIPGFWIGTTFLAILFLSFNFKMIRFLNRKGGVFFGLVGVGLICLYYLYSSLVFAIVAVDCLLCSRRER